MTTQSEQHEALVKEATLLILGADKLSDEDLARAILALILSRLGDVTPEMVEAAWSDGAIADTHSLGSIWRALLAASALGRKEKRVQ